MGFTLKVCGWLVLFLLIITTLFILTYWVPDRPVDELKDRWAKPPSQFIELDGIKIHLRDEGPRDDVLPIVLVHGTSSSLHTWNGWADALKNERRVIRFDLPGFGLTGPAPDGVYTVESYSQTVIEVLNHLGVNQVVLAGNSLGGNVAWITALLHPERVKKLVLVDASGLTFKAKSIPLGFKIAGMPVINKLMAKVLPRKIIEDSIKNVYGDPSLVTEDLIDRYFDLTTRAGNRQALSERLNQTQPGYLAERLPELNKPTLIMWGGKDNLIPPELGYQFHAQILDSKLVIFDELGHVPQEENPMLTVRVLLDSLNTFD